MSNYLFKLAHTQPEIAEYFALRRKIFVEEQALFQNDDVDALDAIAHPIIAVEADAPSLEVLGVVRIYEPEPCLWYGGRLGTHPDRRKGWQIGKGLITKAVTTANHWDSLEEIEIRGIIHHLMQADLDYYPANDEIRPLLQHLQYSQAS
jgi:putative N-acetyltransferase (TIGR04045 family)